MRVSVTANSKAAYKLEDEEFKAIQKEPVSERRKKFEAISKADFKPESPGREDAKGIEAGIVKKKISEVGEQIASQMANKIGGQPSHDAQVAILPEDKSDKPVSPLHHAAAKKSSDALEIWFAAWLRNLQGCLDNLESAHELRGPLDKSLDFAQQLKKKFTVLDDSQRTQGFAFLYNDLFDINYKDPKGGDYGVQARTLEPKELAELVEEFTKKYDEVCGYNDITVSSNLSKEELKEIEDLGKGLYRSLSALDPTQLTDLLKKFPNSIQMEQGEVKALTFSSEIDFQDLKGEMLKFAATLHTQLEQEERPKFLEGIKNKQIENKQDHKHISRAGSNGIFPPPPPPEATRRPYRGPM